jgi:outer membrane lipoprotein-sorting protein
MKFLFGTRAFRLLIGCWAVSSAGFAFAQSGDAPTRPDRDQLPQPVLKVARKNVESSEVGSAAPEKAEHPLAPALVMARSAMANIEANVKDYTAELVKHERIGGKLQDQEYMHIKVRQQPFSVYLYFRGPERLKGQECIYIAGQNNGNMLAHGVGVKKLIGMVTLDPNGALAMSGQRYPITEIGIGNLTRRLIEVAEKDSQYGECDVKFFKGAKINDRVCTCIQVTHPTPRKNFLFNVARVFVDDQLNIPIRYEAYEWPETPGGQPQLLESYTYLNVKLNVGLTDEDFSDKNPKYNFH